jgi:hypothetical protein
MSAAIIGVESAIRTGDWPSPGRAVRSHRTDGLIRFTRDPRNFYLVLNPLGERLGCISNSQMRPSLQRGGPTYFLKRAPGSPLAI